MSVSCPPPPGPLVPADLAAWPGHLAQVATRLRAVFPFRRTHRRAVAYIEGLLGPAPRKNSWPRRSARPLPTVSSTCWAVPSGRRTRRGALYAYVGDHLADRTGVGIIDETGFLKQGTHSAGVESDLGIRRGQAMATVVRERERMQTGSNGCMRKRYIEVTMTRGAEAADCLASGPFVGVAIRPGKSWPTRLPTITTIWS